MTAIFSALWKGLVLERKGKIRAIFHLLCVFNVDSGHLGLVPTWQSMAGFGRVLPKWGKMVETLMDKGF